MVISAHREQTNEKIMVSFIVQHINKLRGSGVDFTPEQDMGGAYQREEKIEERYEAIAMSWRNELVGDSMYYSNYERLCYGERDECLHY